MNIFNKKNLIAALALTALTAGSGLWGAQQAQENADFERFCTNNIAKNKEDLNTKLEGCAFRNFELKDANSTNVCVRHDTSNKQYTVTVSLKKITDGLFSKTPEWTQKEIGNVTYTDDGKLTYSASKDFATIRNDLPGMLEHSFERGMISNDSSTPQATPTPAATTKTTATTSNDSKAALKAYAEKYVCENNLQKSLLGPDPFIYNGKEYPVTITSCKTTGHTDEFQFVVNDLEHLCVTVKKATPPPTTTTTTATLTPPPVAAPINPTTTYRPTTAATPVAASPTPPAASSVANTSHTDTTITSASASIPAASPVTSPNQNTTQSTITTKTTPDLKTESKELQGWIWHFLPKVTEDHSEFRVNENITFIANKYSNGNVSWDIRTPNVTYNRVAADFASRPGLRISNNWIDTKNNLAEQGITLPPVPSTPPSTPPPTQTTTTTTDKRTEKEDEITVDATVGGVQPKETIIKKLTNSVIENLDESNISSPAAASAIATTPQTPAVETPLQTSSAQSNTANTTADTTPGGSTHSKTPGNTPLTPNAPAAAEAQTTPQTTTTTMSKHQFEREIQEFGNGITDRNEGANLTFKDSGNTKYNATLNCHEGNWFITANFNGENITAPLAAAPQQPAAATATTTTAAAATTTNTATANNTTAPIEVTTATANTTNNNTATTETSNPNNAQQQQHTQIEHTTTTPSKAQKVTPWEIAEITTAFLRFAALQVDHIWGKDHAPDSIQAMLTGLAVDATRAANGFLSIKTNYDMGGYNGISAATASDVIIDGYSALEKVLILTKVIEKKKVIKIEPDSTDQEKMDNLKAVDKLVDMFKLVAPSIEGFLAVVCASTKLAKCNKHAYKLVYFSMLTLSIVRTLDTLTESSEKNIQKKLTLVKTGVSAIGVIIDLINRMTESKATGHDLNAAV